VVGRSGQSATVPRRTRTINLGEPRAGWPVHVTYASSEVAVDQRLESLGAHTNQEWTQPIGSASGEDVLRDVARVASDSLGERLIAALCHRRPGSRWLQPTGERR
jgi:hypothetical protein